jgi:hypothetical protein
MSLRRCLGRSTRSNHRGCKRGLPLQIGCDLTLRTAISRSQRNFGQLVCRGRLHQRRCQLSGILFSPSFRRPVPLKARNDGGDWQVKRVRQKRNGTDRSRAFVQRTRCDEHPKVFAFRDLRCLAQHLFRRALLQPDLQVHGSIWNLIRRNYLYQKPTRAQLHGKFQGIVHRLRDDTCKRHRSRSGAPSSDNWGRWRTVVPQSAHRGTTNPGRQFTAQYPNTWVYEV